MQSTTSTTRRSTRSARRPAPPHLVLVHDASARTCEAALPDPTPRRIQPLTQHILTAIRAALGFMFVACGLSGFLDLASNQAHHAPGSAMALGGALVVAGSIIPLLKGTEVLLETLLDTFQKPQRPRTGSTR